MDIISEILQIAYREVLKTQIMYRANLSFAQLNDYLTSMLAAGLLAKIIKKNSIAYISTEKGQEFLRKYREIVCLLSSQEDDKEYLNSLILRKNLILN